MVTGTELAKQVKDKLRPRIERLKRRDFVPGLVAVLFEDSPEESRIYATKKKDDCEELGIYSDTLSPTRNISYRELRSLMGEINLDPRFQGIIIQQPFPEHLQKRRDDVVDLVAPGKDVDGLTSSSIAQLYRRDPFFEPCTPKGIVRLLDANGINPEGKHAVIVGRGYLVGEPLALMLRQRNATVTVCHSYTQDLGEYTRSADILVVATSGTPQFIDGTMVKEGAAVFDCGVYRDGDKLIGNVNYRSIEPKAGYLTRGGVGVMTRAMLLENTVLAAESYAGIR